MDVNTGELIRPTDYSLQEEEKRKREGKEYLTQERIENILKKENSKYRDPNNPYEFYRNKEVASL